MIAGGFPLLLMQLIIYRHVESLQIVGTASVVLGLVASLLGIGARGRRRTRLVIVFVMLSLSGVLGLWFHNLGRFDGEQGEQPSPGEAVPADDPSVEPPVLASLSVSGLCIFGAVMLLAKRDDE